MHGKEEGKNRRGKHDLLLHTKGIELASCQVKVVAYRRVLSVRS